MFKSELKVTKDDLTPVLKQLKEKMSNFSPMMKNIGEILLTSIRKNFETGGRPSPWQGLKASTMRSRRSLGHWPGKILIVHGVSGGLLGSISYKASSDKVVMSANKVYAAVQNFGGQAGRAHKANIPARPFMMVQDEDWAEIKNLAMAYLKKQG